MKYKVKGELCLKNDMAGFFAMLLKYKEIPIASIKRKDYMVEFIINTTSETDLKDILQELLKYERFILLEVKERKGWF